MSLSSFNQHQIQRLHWPTLFVSAGIGMLLSWGLLSGDQQGRVNILYLLVIFVCLPLGSFVLSVFFYVFGRGVNFASLLARVPIWSHRTRQLFEQQRLRQLDKLWFFWQSQAAALVFAIVSLLVFFVLLLVTDVNFVWRSTLLSASDLQGFLQVLSRPWSFWQAAQPDLTLLQSTQNSRLNIAIDYPQQFARWWPFVLACQITYCLLPRSILCVLAARRYSRALKRQRATPLPASALDQPQTASSAQLHPVENLDLAQYALLNWAGLDTQVLQRMPGFCAMPQLVAGARASAAQQQQAQQWQGKLLVLVKSWEPPLGELADFIQNKQGALMPLDCLNGRLCQPQQQHILEWQRFADQLNWRLYIPPLSEQGAQA